MRRTSSLILSLALAALSFHLSANAHDSHEDKHPTLELNASASKEVTLDTVTITMSYEHHGESQTQVAQQVNARIGAALAKAKAVKQVKARTGSISTWSRLDKNRKPIGWIAKGTLVMESTDLEAAAKLAGELSNTLTFANSYFSLSRTLHNQTERELLQDAAQAFQRRSQEAAVALGYQRVTIKAVELSGEGNVMQQQRAVGFSMAAAPAMKDEASAPPPLQLEPGTMTVSVGLRGTVYLLEGR